MANTLQLYFPQLRERQQVLDDIMSRENLKTLYGTWKKEQQEYLLLRQYKRVRGEKGKTFSYKDIKKVYSIIFYEQSPKEFHAFPQNSIHRSKQRTDTGIEIELLQEFLFIPLDITKKIYENNSVRNKLEAWLIFLSSDNPEIIVQLIDTYPEFREMYEDVCDLCLNTEKVMNMFSKELQQLDKNTVQYMIDEMQDEIDSQKERLQEQKEQLQEKDMRLQEQKEQLQEKDAVIAKQAEELEKYRKMAKL